MRKELRSGFDLYKLVLVLKQIIQVGNEMEARITRAEYDKPDADFLILHKKICDLIKRMGECLKKEKDQNDSS